MRTTFLFRQNLFANVAKLPAAITGNRFCDDIYLIAIGTMPARCAMSARSKNRTAIGTTPVFGGTNRIRCMLFRTSRTIPDIGAGFADFQNGRVFGTVPMIGIIADKIRGVVRLAGFVVAVPVMCAVCFGIVHAFATLTVTVAVTAVGALRQRDRVFLLTSRTIPVMCATDTRRFRFAAAGFAVPGAVAGRIRRMPIVAV